MAETATATEKPNYSRKTLRAIGREKRNERIRTDKDFAKQYFEGKSKRSAAKKVAFKRRHAVKK
jgi:hypothetical protein